MTALPRRDRPRYKACFKGVADRWPRRLVHDRADLMTYCCGIMVRDGLVMIADTRPNAGLENIAVSRRLHSFAIPGERIMAVATAGNLALTQSVMSTLHEGYENAETGERETL